VAKATAVNTKIVIAFNRTLLPALRHNRARHGIGELTMATNAQGDAKTIFEPENVPELLHGWLLHAHKGRARHDLAARRCDTQRFWIGGSAAVVSAVVGTSVFATLEKAEIDFLFKVGIAFIAIVAAILTNLTAFLNLAERAEKHRSAGVRYKIIIRELERLRAHDFANAEILVPAMKKQLDDLEEIAPVVPERYYDQVEDEWKEKGVEFVGKAVCLYPGKAEHCPSKPEPQG
jgi:hypothetical protein